MKEALYFHLSLWGVLSLPSLGQESPPIPSNSPLGQEEVSPDSNVSTAIRSTEVQTIERAGKDLQNPEVGTRVGAAKLLGKYSGTQPMILLVGALDDSSPLVRRSAMVSLSEHFAPRFPYSPSQLPRSIMEKIFSKLGDADVEVRREVSTLIPYLVRRGLMGGGMQIVEINGQRVVRSVRTGLRDDLSDLTRRAFLDPDAIVRQNVLKNHLYLGVSLPVGTLEKLLADSDLGVLLTALERIYSNAGRVSVVDRIEELSQHEDRGIRLKVVAVARDANRYHPKYRAILRGMTQDKDPEVVSMAAVELARFGEKIPSAVVDRIKEFLLGVQGMSSRVTTILYSISAMGEDSIRVYEALTEHSSSQMRKVAWQRYVSLSAAWNKPEIWMRAMEDRDKTVREAVLISLRGRSTNLTAENMQALVESKYADVRIFAGQSLLTANPELIEEFGFDLLIDEDTIVRSTTIRAMASRRTTGWLKVMSRSLLDEDFVIQRAAMDGLLAGGPEGVKTLRDFVSKNPRNRISSLASSELRIRGVQP